MNVYIPYCTEMLDTLTRESEKLFVEICVSRREPGQMGWIKFKVSNQAWTYFEISTVDPARYTRHVGTYEDFVNMLFITDDAAREAKIELDFRIRENEVQVRNELVKKAGLITTTQAEINALAEEAQAANVRASQTEFDAVKRAEQALHAKYGSEIANLKADQKVELAELNAQAKSDATTIALLKGQIASLEETIKANRDADVQKAEAASKAAGVVVNAGK